MTTWDDAATSSLFSLSFPGRTGINMASMMAESSRQAAAGAPSKQDDGHRYKILVCGWRK